MYRKTEKIIKNLPNTELLSRWKEVEVKQLIGWDLSFIDSQTTTEPLPWNYRDIVLGYLKKEMDLLDMGTGGGEFLLTLNHPYMKTSVSEGYRPNYELCLQSLKPLGVRVQWIDEDDKIPYPDNSFDVVINRHESFNLQEVRRVLKPKGLFITQQVGSENNYDLSQWLIGAHPQPFPDLNLKKQRNFLEHSGFDWLEGSEAKVKTIYHSIDALVYSASIFEWEFPGFSVEKYYDRLLELYFRIENNQEVYGIEHRFYFVVENRKEK